MFLWRNKEKNTLMCIPLSEAKLYVLPLFVLCHAKMCLWADADSEGPDQTAHLCSLIRAFTVCK